MSEATEVKSVVDEFDAAFSESAAALETAPTDAVVVDEPKKDAEVTTPPADETADAKATREAAEKTAAETAAAKALANETPEQKTARETAEAETARRVQADADAQLQRDAATATIAAEERRKAEQKIADDKAVQDAADAAKAETPEQKAAREQFEATIAPYEFTAEEKTALEKMKVDFPGEYAVLEARLKQTDRTMNARIHAAVVEATKNIVKVVEPVAQQTQTLAYQTHMATIRAGHTDFDTVVGKIPDWIKTQPAYLQPAMQAVYAGGDAASVVQLVSDFKKATGVVTVTTPANGKTAEQLAAEATAKATQDAVDEQARKDAAALVPVNSKRTTPTPKGAVDVNNFDAAFDEAAAALEIK